MLTVSIFVVQLDLAKEESEFLIGSSMEIVVHVLITAAITEFQQHSEVVKSIGRSSHDPWRMSL